MVKKRVGTKKKVSLEKLIENPRKSPISSYNKPTKIEIEGNDFKLGFINTIYAGSVTNKKLVENFLKYAQAKSLDAVLISGNTIWLDLKQYSKNKLNRAELTEIFSEKDYKWRTLKERLDLVVEKSLKPLFYKRNKPIYKGPIYITFGEMEQEFVDQYVNEYNKLEKTKQLNKVSGKISEIKTQMKTLGTQLKKYLKDIEKESEEHEREPGAEALVIKTYNDGLEMLAKKIEKLKEKKNDYVMDNIPIKFLKNSGLAVQNYLIQKIENAIPNSKVVSTGDDGFFKIGNKTVKLKHNTGSLNTLMDKLVEKTRVKLPFGEHPDIVVAGGLSATYTEAPVPYVNKKGKNKEITLIQLPTCLDEKSLKEIISSRVKFSGNKIVKLTKRIDFNSGALVLEYIDGLERREFLPSDYLTNDEMFNSKVKKSKTLYEMNVADQHHGSKYETLIETKDNYEYAFNVSMNLLDKINAPILRFLSLGDETQGKNYQTDQEAHKQHLLPSKSSKLEEKIMKQFSKNPERLTKELRKLRKLQEVRSGIIIPQDQTHDFLDILNYKFLKKVIKNAREAKLLGPIIYFIAGNHDQHTFDGMVKTTKDIAYFLREKLDVSEEEVCAPILGLGGVYTGHFGIKGKYKWAEYARHKQGSSRNAKDPSKRTKIAFIKKGLDFPEFSDSYTINRSGHNHMGGQTTSKKTFHDVSYCYMDRNYYGEKLDYGSPARGFKILGFPEEGPSTGPIITIKFPLEYLQKWANEKPKINTKKLFGNSVI